MKTNRIKLTIGILAALVVGACAHQTATSDNGDGQPTSIDTCNNEQLSEDTHTTKVTEQESLHGNATEKPAINTPTQAATANTTTAESNAPAAQSCSSQTDCAHCTYCGHCSPCPVGIDIARVNILLDKAKGKNPVPADVAAEYKALEHHASECVGCGACERRCPSEVPVRKKMQEAAKTFGY